MTHLEHESGIVAQLVKLVNGHLQRKRWGADLSKKKKNCTSATTNEGLQLRTSKVVILSSESRSCRSSEGFSVLFNELEKEC